MKKKILLGFGALALAVVTVPMFAAFEAHVINVTATIENALSVNTTPISFGTVFPQEQLDRQIKINLSDSFKTEGRVDDVQYIIRQKPKCMNDDGKTTSGHVDDNGVISCPNGYDLLPLLCRYLSKHPVTSPEDPSTNDGSLDAFHPIGWLNNGWEWNDVKGYLAKSQQDYYDTWNLDLKVPCFEGNCAQDWADYVHKINPYANPDDYVQPKVNEHQLFGCDIWIEVTGVSRTQCNDGIDNDNDGLIDYPADKGCINEVDNNEINEG